MPLAPDHCVCSFAPPTNDPTSWAALYGLTPAQLAARWSVRAGDRIPSVDIEVP